MGSLNATGITVVSKSNVTIRQRGGRQVVKSDSLTDTETTLVQSPPEHVYNSGSVVRDSTSVVYTSGIVNGLYMGGRSASARIPSAPGTPRDLKVNLAGNKTIAVIPSGLTSPIPQTSVEHLGSKLVKSDNITDTNTDVSDSGVYGPR